MGKIWAYIPSITMFGITNITSFAKHMINPVKFGIPHQTLEIKDVFWLLEMLENSWEITKYTDD